MGGFQMADVQQVLARVCGQRILGPSVFSYLQPWRKRHLRYARSGMWYKIVYFRGAQRHSVVFRSALSLARAYGQMAKKQEIKITIQGVLNFEVQIL
jgi:hypothetical protein